MDNEELIKKTDAMKEGPKEKPTADCSDFSYFLTKNENGERSVNVGTQLLRLLTNCAILRVVRKKTT